MGIVEWRTIGENSLLPRRQCYGRLALLILALVLCVGCGRLLAGCAASLEPEGDVAEVAGAAPSDETPARPDAGHAGGEDASNENEADPAVSSEDNQKLTLADIPADVLVSVEELQQMRESVEPPFIVDVRPQGWWIDGHIPEARNIPAGKQFDIRMDEIPKGREVVVIVPRTDERVAEVWQTLVDNGYDLAMLKALDGGMEAWSAAGMDIQQEEHLGC